MPQRTTLRLQWLRSCVHLYDLMYTADHEMDVEGLGFGDIHRNVRISRNLESLLECFHAVVSRKQQQNQVIARFRGNYRCRMPGGVARHCNLYSFDNCSAWITYRTRNRTGPGCLRSDAQ